jgi:SPP1 gp7 family putative phage head morphogenesis protein
MDFVEQSKMSMEEILSAFGVPKSEIGLMENIQRANAETSSYVFTKNTIMPIMKKIAKSISKAILKDYKDLSYIEAVNIVPDNKEQLLAEWTVGVDKWITRNEIRNHLGLPLIQGGDTLYSEFNKVEIDSQIKTVKSNNKLESKQNNNFVIESVFNKLNKALEYKKLAKENIKEVNIKTWEVIFKKYEPELINSIQKYFKDQEKALLKKISGKKSISINKVKDLLNGNWYDSQISLGISFITPKLMEYILSGEKQGNDLLGTEDSISNSKIESFVKSRAEYFSNSINNTTKENLINSIAEGIGKGENDSKIIDRVKTIYTIATDSRSKMIARTEISASANYGKIELFKTAGVESLEWVVVNPEDDDCFENEGVVINIGDNFPSGISAPPVHPNCMCSINPVFNTEE